MKELVYFRKKNVKFAKVRDLLKLAKEKYAIHVGEQEFIQQTNVGHVMEQENTKNFVGDVKEKVTLHILLNNQ